jgi:hypothetical protein
VQDEVSLRRNQAQNLLGVDALRRRDAVMNVWFVRAPVTYLIGYPAIAP